MCAAILWVVWQINSSSAYTIGAVIALMILGYLVITLVKPEKF